MGKLRDSSIVVLTRETGDGELEIYLVLRAPTLRFFGGYLAFPGGVVDRADRAPGGEDPEGAFLRCAVRELFEETGVLVPELRGVVPEPERAELRRGLLEDDPAIRARWEEIVDGVPDVGRSLQEFGTMVTPAFSPLRYRARLYHLPLPEGEEPSIVPGELTDGGFRLPREVLETWRGAREHVVPPVLFLLEALGSGSLDEALAAARRTCADLDDGGLHIVRCAPGIGFVPLRTPTLPPATTTNCCVIGEERVFLVDPATPHADEQARLVEAIPRWAREGVQVEGILLTHHHPDHVGAVNVVSRRFDLPVHAHPLTLDRIPAGFRRGRELLDGDELELAHPDGAPWSLGCVHTPGHDRGHLIFVESRHRGAVVGDLVSTLSTIVIDPPEGHLATYLASLERARGLDLGVLVPAHGPFVREGSALLGEYLEHRRDRERALVRALARGPATPPELVAAVYTDVDPALHALAERSLLAGLQKLGEEGRAQPVDGQVDSRGLWRADAGSAKPL